MKQIKHFFIIVLLCTLFLSCKGEKGTSDLLLNGTEDALPLELKGLKVYEVRTSIGGDYVKVAILNDEVISTAEQVGKHDEYTIIINKPSNKIINVSKILLENDSIIIIRKQ